MVQLTREGRGSRRQRELVEPHIEHDGQPIRNELTAKYLGVLIDDKLSILTVWLRKLAGIWEYSGE